MLSYQIVVRLDPEELPEVSERHGCIGLEAEVRVVVGWGEVAPLTVSERQAQVTNEPKNIKASEQSHIQ